MNDLFTAFRQAIEGGDVDAAVRLFSDDVRFFSPVVHKPYVGHEPLRAVLGGVLTELAVMVRPYSAATALRERMAALLP